MDVDSNAIPSQTSTPTATAPLPDKPQHEKELLKWLQRETANIFQSSTTKDVFINEKLVPMMNKFYALNMKTGAILCFQTPNNRDNIPECDLKKLQTIYCNSKIRWFNDDKCESKNPAQLWMNHSARKTYLKCDFDPSLPVEHPDVCNLFTGFWWKTIPKKEINMELIKPFLDHINAVIASSNETHRHYITCWLSNIIKRPGKPADVALVLFGS